MKSLAQYSNITLPLFMGEGLKPNSDRDPVKLSLLQLTASNDTGLEPDYATTLVTTGNLRPVGVLTSMTPNGGVVEPGEVIRFDSALSRDDGQANLQRQWSILRAPVGATLPEGEALQAVSLELKPELPGDYIVQLIVNDGQLTSVPQTYRVRIENEPPIANAGEGQNVLKGNLVALNGTASSDPEGNELSYAWAISSAPEGSTATLVNADTATPSFTPEIPGLYDISLVVSDGILESEADNVRITIENRAPIAVATGMTEGFAGDTIMVSGQQSTDADGDILTYTWSIIGPEGSTAQFDDPFVVAPSFVPDLGGVYTLNLVVFDGFVESEPAELILNISDANRPPVLELVGDKSVALGSSLAVQLTATDPDGDVISFGASPLPLPIGARFDVSTGIFQYTPTPDADADFSIIVSATDGVLTDSETIRIQITNENASDVTSYSGQVLDSQSGEPVSGVVISAANQTATTDENGLFTLTSLPAGDILIWVFADENTQTSSDGLAYAGTTIAATLYENTANQATQPVRLSTVESGSPVNAAGVTTLTSSGFGLTVEIPSGALENTMSGDPYTGDVSISAISAEQANALPPNIVPCQLFSLQPKTVSVVAPVTLTVNNYDNLPAGSLVDVWFFSDGSFEKRGVGTVSDDASTVKASLRGFSGGELIALSPRPNSVVTARDQPSTTYVPSLLGEGNYGTSLSLPGYTSNGASRGLSYVYNSTAAAPEPIAAATVTLGDALPESVSARIMIGGVDYGTDPSVRLSGANAGDTIRQAVQISADNLPTGVNEYEFISISEYACTKVGQVATGEIFVDNQTDSPFGQGWSLAELGRLYPQGDGSVLVQDGNGRLTNFEARTDFSTLGDPVRLPALGPYIGKPVDLDGDGDQDILWLLPEEGGIGVYENLGDEKFAQKTILRSGNIVDVPPFGIFPPDVTQLATGDFDSDGRIDIALGSQVSDRLVVFFGEEGQFSFGSAVTVANLDVRSLQAADFDGDGDDDLVAFTRGAIRPYFYAGSPTRNLRSFRLEGSPSGSILGSVVRDYNKDGLPDIVTRTKTRITGWRSRQNQTPIRDFGSNGSFNPFLGESLEVIDIDNDGVDEVLVGSENTGVLVYQRNDARIFELLETLNVSDAPLGSREFSVADINEDGRSDVVVASGTRIVTFLNDPNGTFEMPEVVQTGFSASSARLADFNQDSSIDVVVDSQSEDELFIYFSNPMQSDKFIDPLNDYTELVRNDDGTYERRYKDGATIFYAASGLQTGKSDSNGNVTSYTYDDQDRLSTITDPVGLVTNFTYGLNGKLTQITYPDGRTSKWTYNDAGQLIRSEDVNGDVTLHAYDEQGRLTAKTDPRGLTTDILYGPSGRYAGSTLPDGTELKLELAKTLGLAELGGGELTPGSGGVTKVQDGRGNITETRVNDYGSPIEITDPLGRVTRYTRDDNNNVIAVDAPSSVTGDQRLLTEMDYDELGNVIAKREAVGTAREREMTYVYEPVFNKMISMIDFDGFETTRTYDEFGNMLTETDPLGGVMTMTYDERGLPTGRTDKNNNLTQLFYNDRGLVTTTIDPSGTISEFTYDDAGNLLTRTDDFNGSLSREMSYTYDNKNRILTETAADGGVTTYAYDGNDNLISTTDPTGIVETRSYDDRDRLQTVNDPASGTTVFTYDEDSNILRMTDALGETTEFTYDAMDRLLSSIDAKGQLRAFAYDSRDNITAVTDARANMTFMGYDELDRPISRTNPKGEQWNFAYDARDNRTSATKPDGVVLSSSYDGLSRLTRIVGGDIERTYGYDAQSNLLAANGSLSGEAGPDLGFTYDGENRLETASVTNLFGDGAQNNVFTYGYDALDRRASMADSFGGNTAYAYDPVDRLTQITTPTGEVFTQSYDLAGRMLGRIAPNSTATERAYEDGTGRLAEQTQAAGGATFNGFTYDYTDRGNIAEITETGTLARTKRYSYDELERLTEVAVPEAPTENEAYTLDPEGNRITSQLSDTHETDVANRLTGDDAYSYVYDLNGNLLTKTAKPGVTRPDWTYDYDDLDQLISVSRDGLEVERYRYDAFGRRSVIETANDPGSGAGAGNGVFERTALVNDGSDRTIDLVQDGAGVTQIQNRYTHGGQVDEPLSLEVFASDGTLDQSYTYHADHLGSIRFVTDSVGTIVNAYEYDSYGRPGFELEQVSQPFRYTGREWDQATELYHYRARQYDPETGRFLQEDPIGFEAGDINVYRYVTNKPLSITDPSGKSALIESGGLSQTAASSGQIANLGIGLNCLFASIAASVNTNKDLVSGRTGGASQCGNDLLVGTGLTSGTALGTSVLADGPLPILDHIGFRFAMIAKNLYRFITKICKAGTCKTEETVIMPGSKL